MGEDRDPPAPSFPFLTNQGRATLFVRVTLPLIAIVSLVGSVFLVFPEDAGAFLAGLVAYVLPPAGKESVIPGLVGAGFPPSLVATYIGGIDMTVAWFLAWNWDTVTRLPRIGGLVERVMERGHDRLTRTPLLDRSAFLGLTLFVFIPFQGSGALVGIILGRMVGMPPQRAWVAIMIGALAAALTWAYAAGAFASAISSFGFGAVLQATVVIMGSAAFFLLATRRILRG